MFCHVCEWAVLIDRGGSHTAWSRATYWLRDGFILQSFSLCSWPGFCIFSECVCLCVVVMCGSVVVVLMWLSELTSWCEVQCIDVHVHVYGSISYEYVWAEYQCVSSLLWWTFVCVCGCGIKCVYSHKYSCHETDRQHSFFIENVVTKLPSQPCCSLWQEISEREKHLWWDSFQPSQPPYFNWGMKIDIPDVVFHYISKQNLCDSIAYLGCSLSADYVAVQMYFFLPLLLSTP